MGGPATLAADAPRFATRSPAQAKRITKVAMPLEDYLFEASPRGELRLQLAAAVFRCAESGERDYDDLRRRVLKQFLTPASFRRTGST